MSEMRLQVTEDGLFPVLFALENAGTIGAPSGAAFVAYHVNTRCDFMGQLGL